MKIYGVLLAGVLLTSCQQIEEKINNSIDSATNTVKETATAKVKEAVGKTINETVNSVSNSEDVPFLEIFPEANPTLISEYSGKRIKLPNGKTAFILKYNAEKEVLLKEMEKQTTTDESKSDKVAQKIDGQKFIDQINFFKNFLPDGVLDSSFLNDITQNNSLEFYQIKRFPKKSTIIVNPKNQTIYQFVMES